MATSMTPAARPLPARHSADRMSMMIWSVAGDAGR